MANEGSSNQRVAQGESSANSRVAEEDEHGTTESHSDEDSIDNVVISVHDNDSFHSAHQGTAGSVENVDDGDEQTEHVERIRDEELEPFTRRTVDGSFFSNNNNNTEMEDSDSFHSTQDETKVEANDNANGIGFGIVQEEADVVMVPSSKVHILPLEDGPPPESSANSPRVPLWERLPVATPIFEAEVEVWEFERPHHHHHFGKGFYGDGNQDPNAESDTPTRTRIFTDEEWENPLRCVGKLLGIILALPLYILYKIVTLAWVPRFLRLSDRSIVRPLGMGLDGLIYGIRTIVWCFYKVSVVPVYKVIVYICRGIRFVLLKSLVAIAKGVVRFYESACCQTFLRLISSTAKGIWKLAFFPFWKGLISIPRFIDKCLFQPFVNYMIKPMWYVTSKTTRFVWTMLKSCCRWICDNILKPFWSGCIAFVRTATKTTYKYMLLPIYEGFLCGLTLTYKTLIVPTTKLGWTVLKAAMTATKAVLKGIFDFVLVPLYQGFVSGLSFTHKHLIQPLTKCTLKLLKSMKACLAGLCKIIYNHILVPMQDGFVSGIACMYNSIVVPIYKGIVSTTTCIKNQVLLPLVNFVKDIIRFVHVSIVKPTVEFFKSIVSAVGDVIIDSLISLGNAMTSLGIALKEVIKRLGDSISALFKRIGGLFRW